MFLCDVICLLVATFGYSSFGVDAGTGNILSDVTSNRIPLTFVLMILVLTVLMVCFFAFDSLFEKLQYICR